MIYGSRLPVLWVVSRCPAVPRVDNAVADSQLATKDSVVNYTCLEGFIAANSSTLSTVCDGYQWTTSLTDCQGYISAFAV